MRQGTQTKENSLVMAKSGIDHVTKKSIFRQPTFGRLWTSSVASSLGSAAGSVTINWLVLASTGSALDIALVGIAGIIPRIVFGIISGAVADRYDRLRIMIVANIIRAAIMMILAASLFFYGFQLYLVLISVFTIGVGQSMYLPAVNAFLPTAVPNEDLGSANGLIAAAGQVTSIVGSPLGGVLIGVIGAAATVLFNSVTYIVSGLLILAISLSFSVVKEAKQVNEQRSKKEPFGKEVRSGLNYLKGERGLLKLTLASFGANIFLIMFLTFVVVYADDGLRQGPEIFGLLLAMLGAGYGLGSLLVSRLHSDRRFGLWFGTAGGFVGLCILGLAIFQAVVPAATIFFMVGVFAGFANTTFFTGTQKFVPNSFQGRYYGFDDAGSLAAGPAGQIIGGFVIASAGITVAYTIAGLGSMAAYFGLLLFPDVWSLRVEAKSETYAID